MWRLSRVAPDGTHHEGPEGPLYATRFDWVLPFHPPGLAPAGDASGAFHVTASGLPAYPGRFRRTFGFYEGLAAVEADAGWFHVDPAGRPAYDARFAWVGNFQDGRCPVRLADGGYRHLAPDGSFVGTETWRYAGDYREGAAVVQRTDGLHSHVDPAGCLLHGLWFVDLDVFHKGFARARDACGWHHVDRQGRPAYARRFAAVEPFYNGQARVEREDGGLEVIDELGRTLVELRPSRGHPLADVSADLVSFWRCETLFAAVDLGLFERLPLVEPDARTRRLLDALGEMGMVRRAGDTWEATAKGTLLREDHPQSLAAAARYWATDGRRPWAAVREAVSNPGWTPPDPFHEAAACPERVRSLQTALRPYAEHDYAGIAEVLDPGHRLLLDGGGGSGVLVAAALQAHPDLRGVVLERPDVVAVAEVPESLRDRLSFVAGDIFEPWPVRADAVVLARVLHDWDDARARSILRNARAALVPGGRLYVVELLQSADGFRGGLLSLHMLVSTGGGERTRDAFEALFARAGLHLREIRFLPSVSDVLVVEAL